MTDTKKVRTLLAALDCGSLMHAADKLGYTPSGLAHMMDSFENELGLTVIERGRFGIRLTPEGQRLLPFFKELADADEKITSEIELIGSHKVRRIRVGSYHSTASQWLPSVIGRFQQKYPDVVVDITVCGIDEVYDRLNDNSVDLSFTSDVKKGKCDFIPIAKDYFNVVLPEWADTGDMTEYDISLLNGKPFIIPSYGSDRDVQYILESNNCKPAFRATSADDMAVVAMVSAGLGCSLLSDLVLKGLPSLEVKTLPLKPRSYRQLGIAVKSLDTAPAVVKNFIDTAKSLKLVTK